MKPNLDNILLTNKNILMEFSYEKVMMKSFPVWRIEVEKAYHFHAEILFQNFTTNFELNDNSKNSFYW